MYFLVDFLLQIRYTYKKLLCLKTDDDSRVKVMGGITDFINASYIDVNMI